MSVTQTYNSLVGVSEILTVGVSSSNSDNRLGHDGINTLKTLNADASSSQPAISKFCHRDRALVAAAFTIDLTSEVGTNGAAVDFTGLKVQVIKFKNPAGNAAMTITFGAANPYLLGGAAFKWILPADSEITFYANEGTPDVAGGSKDIDVSGTGTESLEYQITAG